MKDKERKSLPFSIANNFKYDYVKHLAADFETCFNEQRDDVRVWAWGLADIFSFNFEHGNSIDSFMERLTSDTYVYDVAIHNLKFDGNFILPYLYRNGYTYLSNKEFMDGWKSGKDLSKCFTHNITTMGQWFSLTVCKETKATKDTPAFIHFWDSLKLFPQTLKEVGEQYCSLYKKIDEDASFYEALRPVGHALTDEELHYLQNDCLVLCEALQAQYARYGSIYRTRASKAFNFFKEACFDEESRTNLYKMKYEGLQQYRVPKVAGFEDLEGAVWRFLPKEAKQKLNKAKVKLEKDFEYYIPNYKSWCELKSSYRGGISYVNEFYKELSIEEKITVIDVNSMYPACLRNCPMPFGRMIRKEGKPDDTPNKTWIACARVSFKVKNDWNLPCIQIKELYGREWLKESTDYRKYGYMDQYNEDYVTFTKVDYETFKENYDFVVHEWLYHYEFANMANTDGAKFVDKYYGAKLAADHKIKEIKEKYDDNKELYSKDDDFIIATLERLEAKIIMNSAYGKFGTKYLLLSKQTKYKGPNEPIEFSAETVNFNKEPDDPSHYYLPYAAFVTSYARRMLVRAWNSFKGKAVYCDTDSIHFIGTEEAITEELAPLVDWEETGGLGLWKIEGEFIKGRYIRAKTYIEIEKDGTPNVVCAGATKDVKKIMDWDTFRVGFDAWEICKRRGLDPKEHSRLKPKHYPSGVDLIHENFQIKP